MRFGIKGKLCTSYVETYKILQRVGDVSYEFALPVKIAYVHLVFHVSMINKCVGDPGWILPVEGLGVYENLSYKAVPIDTLDRQVKWLRSKGDCHRQGIVEISYF